MITHKLASQSGGSWWRSFGVSISRVAEGFVGRALMFQDFARNPDFVSIMLLSHFKSWVNSWIYGVRPSIASGSSASSSKWRISKLIRLMMNSETNIIFTDVLVLHGQF